MTRSAVLETWVLSGLMVVTITWSVGCDRAERIGSGGPSSRAVPPSAGSASPRGESASSEAERDDRYRLRATPSTIATGERATVSLEIRAGEGLKPNREFPAWSMTLEAPEGVSLGRTSWDREDFSIEGDDATVQVPLEATDARELQLQGRATFSVCNDQTCHVLRDRPVSFALASTSSD
jgi:hypothetical protein